MPLLLSDSPSESECTTGVLSHPSIFLHAETEPASLIQVAEEVSHLLRNIQHRVLASSYKAQIDQTHYEAGPFKIGVNWRQVRGEFMIAMKRPS